MPLGLHDVRLVTRLGVSNPRAFHVGTLDVVREKEPNDDVDKAQKVEIGTTIFGVISGNTDVDYYTFAGKKGQRLVISCLTISIDSRLYPEIRVFDSEQRQIAFHRPLPGSDAVTSVTLPANGNYFIRINQFTYNAGGPDHFYLLSLSTGPWIDAVFPPVVEPGRTTQRLALVGRNLPDGKIDPRAVIDGKTLEKCTVVVSAPADAQSLTRLAFSGAITPPQGLLDGFEYRLARRRVFRIRSCSPLPGILCIWTTLRPRRNSKSRCRAKWPGGSISRVFGSFSKQKRQRLHD